MSLLKRPSSGAAFSFVAFLFFAGGCLSFGLGTGGPDLPRWMFVYALATLAVCYALFQYCRGRLNPQPLDIFVLAFAAYVWLSVLWTPDWREGALHAQNIAAAAVAGLLLARLASPKWIVAVVVAAVVMFWTHPRVIWGGFGNENWLTEFLLVGSIGCFACLKDRLWKWPATVAILGAWHWLVFVSNSDSRFVGLGGVWVLGMVWLIRRKRRFHAALLALLPLNGMLFLYRGDDVRRAVYARIETVWDTGILWIEKPLTGWGIGSFNFEYPRVQEAHLRVFDIDTMLRPVNVYAGAAHNEYVQVLAETGIIGAALLCLVVVAVRWRAGPALYALAAMAGFAGIAFPFQNPATVLLTWALLGVLSPVCSRSWSDLPSFSGFGGTARAGTRRPAT